MINWIGQGFRHIPLYGFEPALSLLASFIGLFGLQKLCGPKKEEKILIEILKGFLLYILVVIVSSLYWGSGFSLHLVNGLLIGLFRALIQRFEKSLQEKGKGLSYLLLLYCSPFLVYFFVHYFLGQVYYFGRWDRFLLVTGGFYFLVKGGSKLVKASLNYCRCDEEIEEETSAKPAGWLIGLLERSLFFILILNGNIASIGFVLAFKSLARFEDLKKQSFAEYYLIGTMLSALLAIAVGLVIKGILGN